MLRSCHRKLTLQDQVESANARVAQVEKARQRMQGELEDAQLEAERVGVRFE